MKNDITKEIIIMLLLIILIMLIMAVGLYDFVPSSISIPKGLEYNSDKSTVAILQEIEYTNGGDSSADLKNDSEELSTLLKSYTIDATDLAMYGEKKLYISGNSNPFDYGSEETAGAAGGANSTAENIELSAGKYTVGTQVKPGNYTVIAKAGHGNFYVKGSVNEIMGVEGDDFYIKEYKNLTLKEGDEIEVSGSLKVLLDSGNSSSNTSTSGGTASGTTNGGGSASGGTTTGGTAGTGSSSNGGTSSGSAGKTSNSSSGTFFESPDKK